MNCSVQRDPWGALQGGPVGPWPDGPRPTQHFGCVGHNAFGPTNNWHVCSSNWCYHMTDFKANASNPLSAGLCPRPRWWSLQRSFRPHSCIQRPTSKGRQGKGRSRRWFSDGKRRGKKGKRGEKEERVKGGIWPTQKVWRGAPYGKTFCRVNTRIRRIYGYYADSRNAKMHDRDDELWSVGYTAYTAVCWLFRRGHFDLCISLWVADCTDS